MMEIPLKDLKKSIDDVLRKEPNAVLRIDVDIQALDTYGTGIDLVVVIKRAGITFEGRLQ